MAYKCADVPLRNYSLLTHSIALRDVPDIRFRFRFRPSCSQKPDI